MIVKFSETIKVDANINKHYEKLKKVVEVDLSDNKLDYISYQNKYI
jgi:hypothetical protein